MSNRLQQLRIQEANLLAALTSTQKMIKEEERANKPKQAKVSKLSAEIIAQIERDHYHKLSRKVKH